MDLYARASQQYPGNQEILTHLFMAFVRIGDYQKQQQVRGRGREGGRVGESGGGREGERE